MFEKTMFSTLPYTLVLGFMSILFFYIAIIIVKRSALRAGLKAWFRSSSLLTLLSILLSLSFIFAFVAFDFSAYSSYRSDTRLASVEINKIDQQYYNLVLTGSHDKPITFYIYGDMWQMDVRLIDWSDFLARLGMDAVYRLERLSGKYHSIEDEALKPRSVYPLNERARFFDTLKFVSDNFWVPVVKARYGSGAYVPLVHDAKYLIFLGKDGLQIRPDNQIAESGLNTWK